MTQDVNSNPQKGMKTLEILSLSTHTKDCVFLYMHIHIYHVFVFII